MFARSPCINSPAHIKRALAHRAPAELRFAVALLAARRVLPRHAGNRVPPARLRTSLCADGLGRTLRATSSAVGGGAAAGEDAQRVLDAQRGLNRDARLHRLVATRARS